MTGTTPYYEVLGMVLQPLAGQAIPPLVAQIADGENGGVMMNEIPSAFVQDHQHIAREGGGRKGTVAINGTEYLELLEAAGVTAADFPPIQAVGQQRLWREAGKSPSRAAVEAANARVQDADPGFSMASASWTNNLSWVEGYANVLEPMNQLSAAFHQRFDLLLAQHPAISKCQPYQEALLQLLLLETSDFATGARASRPTMPRRSRGGVSPICKPK